MLKNFIKIAFRNLSKHKGYTFINIAGLAVGMAVCILILMYIQNELGYDKFHEKSDRIYRMALDRKYPGRMTSYAIIPQSFGEAALKEYPEVEAFTRIFPALGNFIPTVTIGEDVFEERNMLWADSTFFNVFTVPLIAGDPATALTKENTVVLSESTAKRYFGSTDVLGRTIKTDISETDWVVTGVSEDMPERSHFTFDLLVSAASIQGLEEPNFVNFQACTYLLLQPGASPETLEAKFPQLVEKYVAGEIERRMGINYADYVKAGNGYDYYLQPLENIHLYSNLEGELSPPGSIQTVYTFIAVAIIILLLACINFTNLATARSLDRAKEVGLRKMFGSERTSLISQFLTESVFMSVVSLMLTFVLLGSLTPLFNSMSGMELSLDYWLQPLRIAGLVGFAIIVGLLAGMYPAFALSGFRPIVVLRGKFKNSAESSLLRNGLVVFQFFISISLIIATLVVYQQLQFIQSKKLGFNEDYVLIVNRSNVLNENADAFRDRLTQLAGVENVASTSAIPGSQGGFFGISFTPDGSNEPLIGRGMVVNEDFFETMQMNLTLGRSFSKDFQDSTYIILNETAAEGLDMADPIGKTIRSNDEFLHDPEGNPMNYTIVGVIEDFHFQSLHQKIEPLFFISNERFGGGFANQITTIRIKPGAFQSTLAEVENLWQTLAPGQAFNYEFLDTKLAALYANEKMVQSIFIFFAGLAIFIACMGLLGLAAYTISQRTKEIGIRKVMGANVNTIVMLLSKDFLKLVLIAALIAFPIAWWGMNRWLEDFAYRINIQWWVFVVAGSLAVLIAFLTVSFQSIKAALANPVRSLRSE